MVTLELWTRWCSSNLLSRTSSSRFRCEILCEQCTIFHICVWDSNRLTIYVGSTLQVEKHFCSNPTAIWISQLATHRPCFETKLKRNFSGHAGTLDTLVLIKFTLSYLVKQIPVWNTLWAMHNISYLCLRLKPPHNLCREYTTGWKTLLLQSNCNLNITTSDPPSLLRN